MRLLLQAVIFAVLGMQTLSFLFGSKKSNFMDCDGNDKGLFGTHRKCCPSTELPHDCECFDISRSKTDFLNSQSMLPMCPDSLEVQFFLYTRVNRKKSETIKAGFSHVSETGFSGSRKTVIVAHGFTDSGYAPWMAEMKNTLLKKEDLNVILVEWSRGACGPNYAQATANTRTVGAMIAKLIVDLTQFKGASLEKFHLVGHSLGAHIMGYAGKETERLLSETIGRITGLDPAGPNFEKYSKIVHLDADDANFVDVIHSDAEPFLSSGFGTRKKCGDVDFWPNGGEHQPGCPKENGGILSLLQFEKEKRKGACSHSMAIYFFINSIFKCKYMPPKGGSDCRMGYYCNPACREENIKIKTSARRPFC